MKASITALAAIACLAAAPAPATAGPFADDLGRCLVVNTSTDDQLQFIRWMFAAMARHPAVEPMSNITAAQRDEMDTKVAELATRLLTHDCRQQMIAAIKNESPAAIEQSFELLGKVAMQGLMTHPGVQAAVASYASKLDRARLEDVIREARPAGNPGATQ